MSQFEIPRDDVHRISEACADEQSRFSVVATRLVKDQRRLTRFIKKEVPAIEGQEGQVALYLYAVVIQIFQSYGGRLGNVTNDHIAAARARVQAAAGGILPFDEGFPERVRTVEDRAQPHILDEALHALFEREEIQEQEIDVPKDKAGLIFLILWVATEALDLAWTPPAA
jgi:hypothetical protein